MRKILVYFLGLFFCTLNTIGQNTDLLWVSQFTGTGQSIPSKVTTDVSGNIYVFGSFANTVSQGAFSLTAVGGNDAFIAKYNKNGQILWLKQISGASTETASDIAISSDGAFVFISVLSNTNPCVVSGTSVATTGAFDIILAKFAVDGTLVWAHNSVYGAQNQNNGAMALDNSDNIVLSGGFLVDATFYGGVTTLISPAPAVNQKFISKFDSNGNLTWAKMLVDDNNNTGIRSVSTDAFGYYFCGQYVGTLTLDVGVLSNAGNRDMFIYKTDLTGTGQWVRKIVGTGDDYLTRHKGDALGFQFLTGYYGSPTLTADSTGVLTSVQTFPNAGSNDIFYACYASDGTLQFSKRFGSLGDDQGNAVFVTSDHVILGGQYTGAINFDAFPLTNSGTDAYMVETDRNGTVLSAKRGFGTSTDFVKSANIEASNTNIFVGEFVSANLDIDGKVIVNASVGTRDIFIAKFGLITLNYAVTNVLCNGASTGAIDLTVTGTGTSPYTFAWTGPAAFSSTSEDLVGLAAGVYNVTVTDANGATKTGTTTVTEPSAIALVFAVTDTKCPSSTDGAIDLTVVGGTSPFTYLWTGGITTEDLSALAAGTYDVTVTDANLCVKTGTTTIANPATMILTEVTTPPTCVPGGDGAIDLTVINGAVPYTYSWSNLALTQDISTLVSGTYSVTVTDANLCIVTGSYDVVNSSAPQVIASKTDLTCVPGNDGAIDVLVSGGTIPYTYVWSDGPITTQDRTNLPAGNYIVTVTDAASCSATTAAIVLTVPTSPTISFINTNPTCAPGNDGAIDLIVYSGNPPYTYNWTGAITTQDLTSLSEGTYDVTVTDSKGCFITGSSTITRQFPAATITVSGATTICSGSSIQLNANTGTGLSYQWQLGGVDIAGAIAGSYTASIAGSYTLVVTGENGCVTTSAATIITVNPLPTAIITPAGPTTFCTGGTVQLDATAGVGYTYQWQLNGVDIVGETAVSYIANASGNYTVVVTNAGCSATSSITTVTVTVAPLAVITASGATTVCQGTSVTLMATVGGGNIYQWQESGTDIPGAVSSAFSTLVSGSYTVVVTNINGCATTSLPTVVTVNSYPTLTFAVTNESCAGTNGAVDLTVANGTLPYTFLWDDLAASTTEDLINLVSGTYNVTVNAAGCSTTGSATVSLIPALTASLDNHELIIFCSSNNNGEATLNIQNGVAPFTYTWAGSASTTAFANDLGVGKSYVTVTDFCGTSIVDSITITSLPSMEISVASLTQANCAASTDGSAVVTAVSGIVPYTYNWSGSVSVIDTANDLSAGWHYVTVTDYCGSLIDSVEISRIPALTLTTNLISQVSCIGGSNGNANVVAANGVSPFTYNWSSLELNDTAITLIEGWNYVTVTDFCGSIVDSVLMTVSAPLSIAITSSSPTSCAGGNNGGATVTVTNGASPITYQWSSNNLFSDTLNTNGFANNLLNAWNYIRVTDVCTSLIDSVQISSLPPVTANITFSVLASCPTTADGKATVTASAGTGVYTYAWGAPSTSTSFVAMDLLPGWNYVTVSDGCGIAVDSVNISNQPALSIQMSSLSLITCQGLTNGSAIVTTTDGGAPFTFLWSTTEVNDTALALVEGWNYVTVTDVCGSLVDSINVMVTPVVTATYDKPDGILCFGQATATIEITSLNGIVPYTYTWGDTTLTTYNRDSLSAGKYYFTVTDGCNSTFVDSVTVNQPGALSLSMITTNVSFTGLSDGAIDLLMSGGTQPYYFDWSNGITLEDQKDIPADVYYITVTDNNGCVISDSSNIITDSWHIEVYKAFTPNGDGKNDVWNIKYISAYPECSVIIFDEWGIKVFESTGYTEAWDGTNKKGHKLPAATYYYIIDLKDGSKVYTGSVALIK